MSSTFPEILFSSSGNANDYVSILIANMRTCTKIIGLADLGEMKMLNAAFTDAKVMSFRKFH